jgi:protocatechuate 3,4-dioxygenase beta subunit
MRARLWLAATCSLFAANVLSAAVTGTVVNSDGQAVAGAKVSLFAPETIDARRARLLSDKPQRTALATAESGSGGRFRLDAPKDGPPVVDLLVEANGFAPSEARADRDDDLGAIPLAAAETKRGTITAAGKPVAGATVIWSSSTEDVVATTDAQGHYNVADPAKWAARVTVLHHDFAVAEETFAGFERAKPPLDRALVPGAAVTGRVVGEDGQTPVAGASILVGSLPVATSADDGTFTIAHAPVRWETITAHAGSLAGVRARTASGPVTIRLVRAATISGTVRTAKTQTPVNGVEVRLFRSSGPGGGMGRQDLAGSVLADAKGNYALPAVLPGTYGVLAVRPGYTAQPISVTVAAAQKVAKQLALVQNGRVSGMVVDESKRPVAGAVMMANEVRRDRMAMLTQRFVGRQEAISGPDGTFVLQTMPDSDFEVGAMKKGLPPAKTTTLRVAPGERRANVLLTIPQGVALTGRVVDGQGKPLSGVAVQAEAANGGNGGMFLRRLGGEGRRDRDDQVRTGTDGAFSMRVREGTYDVVFAREGFAMKTVRAQQINAATKPLAVTMEPGVEITGRVTRAGAGVEGVMINVFSEGTAGSATTGPDGSFQLSDLTPGAMMLNARKPDAFIQQMRNVTAPAHDVVIDLPAGGRIVGRVVDKATHNAVTSFQAGISTSRGGGGRVFMMPPQLRSFTSDDGSFVLENVPPGNTQVVVNAPGYAAGHVASLNVEDGKTIDGIEVGLDIGTRLAGRVTGSDGSPISGATVRADDGSPMGMRQGPAATTDGNGEYAIEALEPGQKSFVVAAQGYLSETRTVTLADRETRLDVQLSSGTKVTGVVTTESGAPVADAQVTVSGSGGGPFGGHSARSDASGTFQIDGLAPGHYTFSAEKSPYAQTFVRDVDISSGAPVRIVLKSGATIYGHIAGLSADELQHAQVSAQNANGSADAGVDASGNFRIEGAPSGTVHVEADTMRGMSGGGRNAAPKSVEVAAGATVQVDLEFRNDTTVRGRVTRNGQPLANANVDFFPRGGTAQTQVRAATDGAGMYSVTGADDGSYRVSVLDLERLTPYTTTYELKGSGTFDIDIRVSTVRGRVVDSATGEGIGDAKVDFRGSTGNDFLGLRSTMTDAGGAFLLDGVSPGPYEVTASKIGYGNVVKSVQINDGATDAIDFQLAGNDGITLRVVDGRDGRTLAAFVRALDAQGHVAFDSTQNRFFGGDAAAQVLTVAPGQYQVTISARGYATQTLTLTSPSQQTVGLTPGGTLTVRSSANVRRVIQLVDSSGQLYDRYSFGNSSRTLDPAPAVVTLPNLVPGAYTLQVLDDRGQLAGTTQVTIVEGQTTDTAI